MDLSRHASADTAKDYIRNSVNNSGQHIVCFTIRQGRETAQKAATVKETIGAPNQSDIVFIQSELISFTNHIRCGRSGRSRTDESFCTHTARWTKLLSHRTWLETTAAAKIAL